MQQDRRQPDLNDNLIILMSFCYHSEVIRMGLDYGEDIVDGTRQKATGPKL